MQGIETEIDTSVGGATQKVDQEPKAGVEAQLNFWTLPRTLNFWLIAVAGFLAALVDTAFIQHQVLIFADMGFSQVAIAGAVSLIGACGLFARLIVGNVIDSSSNRGVAGLYLLFTAIAVLSFFLSNPVVLLAFILFRAVGHATVLLDTGVLPKHAFGAGGAGALIGMFTAAASLGFATGPWLMGRLYDATGSYDAAYYVFAVLPLVAAALAWNIKPHFWWSIKRNGLAGVAGAGREAQRKPAL